jgi:hypothetical protein
MLDADALSRKGFHRLLRFDASGLRFTMSSLHLKAVLFDVRLSSHHATVMDVQSSVLQDWRSCRAKSALGNP